MIPTAESYVGHHILEAMRSATRYSSAIFEDMQSAMPPHARNVLDFGAGDGLFVQKFGESGVTVDSVEPDLELRARLQSSGVVAYSDIREIQNSSYDFIYAVNVLEHLSNLEESCAHLSRIIRPHGKLFVFVPAFELLWTKLDDEVGHVRRFTRHSLLDALERAGFTVEKIEYFDCVGFPAALGVRLLEKANLFRYDGKTVGLYDRLLFPISRYLDRLFRNICGKNLIAIAHR
jgi:SAM-dependent methyltransferase